MKDVPKKSNKRLIIANTVVAVTITVLLGAILILNFAPTSSIGIWLDSVIS